jgi:pyruvate formate lyase activating enzyme
VLDYIAIDLKTSPEKYDRLTGVSHSVEAVRESLQVLSQSDIPSEIRTTFVPGLVDKADVAEMISFIREAKHYYIQSFRPKDTLDESYLSVTPYSPETLHDIAELIRSQVTTQVTVRI